MRRALSLGCQGGPLILSFLSHTDQEGHCADLLKKVGYHKATRHSNCTDTATNYVKGIPVMDPEETFDVSCDPCMRVSREGLSPVTEKTDRQSVF